MATPVILGVGASSFQVVYAGTTITSYVRSCTINMESEEVDVTAMGSTARNMSPGLRNDSVELECYQEYSVLDNLVSTYVGSATGATLVVQSSGSTVSASYPKWTLVGSPYAYQPVAGTVGDASTTTLRFVPASGSSITRTTS